VLLQDQHELLQDQHELLQDQHELLQDQPVLLQDQPELLQNQHELLQDQHELLQDQHELLQGQLVLHPFLPLCLLLLILRLILSFGKIYFIPKRRNRKRKKRLFAAVAQGKIA